MLDGENWMKNSQKMFSLIAFVLVLASITLPFWTVIMTAPTYPTRNLSMRVYSSYYEGDIAEWDTVGNLVGVKVPPPIPENIFVVIPIALYLIAALALLSAFKPAFSKIAAIAPFVLLTFLTAFTQYSLYVFGHDLDPNRPLRYVEPFTPPVIGLKKVGTLTTYHLPHIGSLLLIAAGVLLVFAYKKSRTVDNDATSPDKA
jgi:hypothetical protein